MRVPKPVVKSDFSKWFLFLTIRTKKEIGQIVVRAKRKIDRTDPTVSPDPSKPSYQIKRDCHYFRDVEQA